MDALRILVVCTGNICRSPMAQAIGNELARSASSAYRYEFNSAGTHAVPGGAPTDPRACQALERAGYGVETRRARGVDARDFDVHELILAVDGVNLEELRRRCPQRHAAKLRLFLDCAPGLEGKDVPDPYFGNLAGFDRVRQLCEAGIRGLLGFPSLPLDICR
jgi:protein-tyrosine phosphatase